MKHVTAIMSTAIALGLLASQAVATEYGSFSLKPGEGSEVRIGSTYRLLRVCNEVRSAGAVVATIGDHEPLSVAPGLCAEDWGDAIKLQNQATGVAMGTYRLIYDGRADHNNHEREIVR